MDTFWTLQVRAQHALSFRRVVFYYQLLYNPNNRRTTMSTKAVSGFGPWVRQRREHLRLPLRRLAEVSGLDPGNLSKYERGLIAPPKDEATLKRMANGLELKEGTDSYREFLDIAAASAGRLPADLQNPKMVARMPFLFRAARGRKLTRQELEKLAQQLKDL